MKLIITNDLSNKIPLTPTTKIQNRKKYILSSINIDMIEYFYIKNYDLFITNCNIEYLYYKTSKFKNMEIVLNKERKVNREEKYLKLFPNINKTSNNKTSNNKKSNNKTSNNRESKIWNNNVGRGLEISFYSDIYKSMHTSLTLPSTYFYKEDINTCIYKFIIKKKRATHKELIDQRFKEEGINNLVYTGLIIKKGEYYQANDILL